MYYFYFSSGVYVFDVSPVRFLIQMSCPKITVRVKE
jgi:hypothetical protein